MLRSSINVAAEADQKLRLSQESIRILFAFYIFLLRTMLRRRGDADNSEATFDQASLY